MSKVWPHELIRELLAKASASGEARATLDSPREAELFRFAIYGFRRENDIGNDVVITLDDCDVVLRKRYKPVIRIAQEQEQFT